MYSATKHIDGHGRVLGGAILGKRKYCRIHQTFYKEYRAINKSLQCVDTNKGLDTLELRINKQTENTKIIINYLEK